MQASEKHAGAVFERNFVLALDMFNQLPVLGVVRTYLVSAPRVLSASALCMLLCVLDERRRLPHGRATTCQHSFLCTFVSL